MKAYPSYKESGHGWLGEIPAHWNILPLRRGIEFLTDFEANGSFEDIRDNVVIDSDGRYAWYVRATDLENRRLGFEDGNRTCNKETYEFLSKTKLFGGELLITKRGEIGKVYLMPNSKLPATLAPNLYLVRLNGKLFPRFAYLWFKSSFGNPQLVLADKSTTIGALYKNDIRDCLCVFPPLSEQQVIADFLNCKIAQIDTLIEKKQRQIDLLQEQRTALINHAVTKGLRPDASMKDSGVEWIGDTPSHWRVMQIRRLVTDHKQGFYTNEGYVDEGTKLLRITDIDDNSNVDYANCPLVDITENEKEVFGLEIGDFVFARSGSIGRFGIIREKANAVFASYLIRFRFSDKAFPEYIKYYFLSYFFRQALISDLHGGANQNIHAENIKNQYIFLPPVSEQKEIVSKLDETFAPIAQEIEKIKKEIELILEYRTVLISEAVTGKIDVREWRKAIHEYPTGTM